VLVTIAFDNCLFHKCHIYVKSLSQKFKRIEKGKCNYFVNLLTLPHQVFGIEMAGYI
jgi:hypothetical protein